LSVGLNWVKEMRVYAFLIALFLFMLFLSSCSAATVHAALSWNVQTVDENGALISSYCPIVVDSNNTAHIAYTVWSEGTERAWPNYFVMYASWNGSGWSTQKVSNGSAYSLVLDAKGNPHILYSYYAPVYPSPTGLMYASWTGSSWISQTIDPNGAGYGVVALDSSDNPHVAYTDGTSIKYAVWTGSSWNIQTVATYKSGDLAFRLSFALDKNNTPYIIYSSFSYADYSQAVGIRAINVTLATYQNSSWSIQPLSLPPPTGDYGNIVVDSKGYLHSIFTQHHYASSENKTILSTILYGSWNGTAWNTQTVVSNISFNSMSLALDSNDYPHIFTSSGTYASWTGKTWETQTANLNRTAYGPCYLAVNSTGNPHISYLQQSPSQVIANITYATATETTQTSSPTAPTSPAIFPAFTTLTVVAVAIIAVVVVVTYVWRKKTSLKNKTRQQSSSQ
jgi:hypothetical protein